MYVASPLVTANLELITKQFILYRTLPNAYDIKAHDIDTTEKTPKTQAVSLVNMKLTTLVPSLPYTIFKTSKPFPYTPTDIDALLQLKRDLETTQRNNEYMFFILRGHLLDSNFICIFIHAPTNPSMVSESLNQKLGLRGVEMHKKLAVTSLFLIVLPLISLPINIARAETPTMWASYVVDYWQGPRKDGSPVLSIRSNPNNALGPPNSGVSGPPVNFFSLGFGGWIILGFPNPIANGPGDTALVIETTWGSYPLERANVYVSQDGTTWVYAGTVDNGYGQSGYGLVSLPEDLTWVLYVKILDTTDPNPHRGDADGYDLDAVGAFNEATKESALQLLKSVYPTDDKNVNHELEKAIDHIEKSLDPDLWVDDNHLDPKHGHKVFNEEKKAVKILMKLIEKDDTPQAVKEVCQTVINQLVGADYILAHIAYVEAQAGAGVEKVDMELEKCIEEFEKANEQLAEGHYDKAIDHYKKAWEHAQAALKHAA